MNTLFNQLTEKETLNVKNESLVLLNDNKILTFGQVIKLKSLGINKPLQDILNLKALKILIQFNDGEISKTQSKKIDSLKKYINLYNSKDISKQKLTFLINTIEFFDSKNLSQIYKETKNAYKDPESVKGLLIDNLLNGANFPDFKTFKTKLSSIKSLKDKKTFSLYHVLRVLKTLSKD